MKISISSGLNGRLYNILAREEPEKIPSFSNTFKMKGNEIPLYSLIRN